MSVLAELDVGLTLGQIDACQLILIECQQPFIAQIVQAFIERRLERRRGRVDFRVAGHAHIDQRIRRNVVANRKLFRLAALFVNGNGEVGFVRPYLLISPGFASTTLSPFAGHNAETMLETAS